MNEFRQSVSPSVRAGRLTDGRRQLTSVRQSVRLRQAGRQGQTESRQTGRQHRSRELAVLAGSRRAWEDSLHSGHHRHGDLHRRNAAELRPTEDFLSNLANA